MGNAGLMFGFKGSRALGPLPFPSDYRNRIPERLVLVRASELSESNRFRTDFETEVIAVL